MALSIDCEQDFVLSLAAVRPVSVLSRISVGNADLFCSQIVGLAGKWQTTKKICNCSPKVCRLVNIALRWTAGEMLTFGFISQLRDKVQNTMDLLFFSPDDKTKKRAQRVMQCMKYFSSIFCRFIILLVFLFLLNIFCVCVPDFASGCETIESGKGNKVLHVCFVGPNNCMRFLEFFGVCCSSVCLIFFCCVC